MILQGEKMWICLIVVVVNLCLGLLNLELYMDAIKYGFSKKYKKQKLIATLVNFTFVLMGLLYFVYYR